jgi:hypothetical protein
MADEQGDTRYDREPGGLPRWVKVAGVVAAVVVLLVVVVVLVGGGGHTPRRHGPPADPTSAPAGHTPPPGVHG